MPALIESFPVLTKLPKETVEAPNFQTVTVGSARRLSLTQIENRVVYHQSTTWRFRQVIQGHIEHPLLSKAIFQFGNQGPETVREYYVIEQPNGEGGYEYVTQEINLRRKVDLSIASRVSAQALH